MPIGKAKHRFWDRAPRSAQRAERDRHRRTGVRRLSTRSGGLWGFLRGCKGGDSEPLPRPLKGLFPFRERGFLHAQHLRQFYTIPATFLSRISDMRSISNLPVPIWKAQHKSFNGPAAPLAGALFPNLRVASLLKIGQCSLKPEVQKRAEGAVCQPGRREQQQHRCP